MHTNIDNDWVKWIIFLAFLGAITMAFYCVHRLNSPGLWGRRQTIMARWFGFYAGLAVFDILTIRFLL